MNSNSDLRVTPVPPLELIDRTGKAADFPPDILAENPWLSDPIETRSKTRFSPRYRHNGLWRGSGYSTSAVDQDAYYVSSSTMPTG
jgi:hypothetical protein